MPFLTRYEREHSQRHLDPRDPNWVGFEPCECCQLSCPECREDVGQRCDGCGAWVLKGELVQSPDPDTCGAFLECPKCHAMTVQLMAE